VLNSFTDPIGQAVQPFDASLLIGRDAFFGRPFNGKIDEVAIYNHALDPTQIQQLFFNTGYVPPPPPPLTPFQMWQLQYFGCTDCVQAAASADPDGDGQNNMAEFLAGTSPTNNTSTLRILSAAPQGSDVVITWATVGGHTNEVQATAGDANGGFVTNFAPISGAIIISDFGDTTTNFTDAGGATNAPARYYRIRLVP